MNTIKVTLALSHLSNLAALLWVVAPWPTLLDELSV